MDVAAAAVGLERDAVIDLAPRELRAAIRDGAWHGPTGGLAPGRVQANLVVVGAEYALDFLRFCLRNPAACPVIDVTDVGGVRVDDLAAGADLRTDLPRYRVFRDGSIVDEPTEVTDVWPDDGVAFLLGCAMSCDAALERAGVSVRHIADGRSAAVYVTSEPCRAAGPFAGPLVVNLRVVAAADVARAVEVSARYPLGHGAPVHVGAPEALGIDLSRPDYGDVPVVGDGDAPLFYGCGITPQYAMQHAGVPFAITHYPGHMFVTDWDAETNGA